MPADIDIRQLPLHAIGSVIRDLSMLSHRPDDLEQAIVQKRSPLDPTLFRPLRVVRNDGRPLAAGDVVAFRAAGEGAYNRVETLWGDDVPFIVGHIYLGVLCDRRSGRNLNAEFQAPPYLTDELDLQFVSEAGGIGYAIGHSIPLRQKNGSGRAPDVEILGAVVEPSTGRTLNTVDWLLRPGSVGEFALTTPTILVGGSGGDVGKTTTACSIISSLARTRTCAAVKATGTGRFGESNSYLEAGATYVSNQMFVGLPTTYVDERLFASAQRQMVMYGADPNTLPRNLRLPTHRGRELARPDVLVIEFGGDLIEGGIPVMLEDPWLLRSTVAVVLCCECGLALSGTIAELRRRLSVTNASPPVYAAMPWGNVEGVYSRFHPFVERGELTGLVDPLKPTLHDERSWRLEYTSNHRNILSTDELADVLRLQSPDSRRMELSHAAE